MAASSIPVDILSDQLLQELEEEDELFLDGGEERHSGHNCKFATLTRTFIAFYSLLLKSERAAKASNACRGKVRESAKQPCENEEEDNPQQETVIGERETDPTTCPGGSLGRRSLPREPTEHVNGSAPTCREAEMSTEDPAKGDRPATACELQLSCEGVASNDSPKHAEPPGNLGDIVDTSSFHPRDLHVQAAIPGKDGHSHGDGTSSGRGKDPHEQETSPNENRETKITPTVTSRPNSCDRATQTDTPIQTESVHESKTTERDMLPGHEDRETNPEPLPNQPGAGPSFSEAEQYGAPPELDGLRGGDTDTSADSRQHRDADTVLGPEGQQGAEEPSGLGGQWKHSDLNDPGERSGANTCLDPGKQSGDNTSLDPGEQGEDNTCLDPNGESVDKQQSGVITSVDPAEQIGASVSIGTAELRGVNTSSDPKATPSSDPETTPTADPEANITNPDVKTSTDPEAKTSTDQDVIPPPDPEATPSTDLKAAISTDLDVNTSTNPEAKTSTDPEVTPSTDPEATPFIDLEVISSTDPESSTSTDSEVIPSTDPEVNTLADPDVTSTNPEVTPSTDPEANTPMNPAEQCGIIPPDPSQQAEGGSDPAERCGPETMADPGERERADSAGEQEQRCGDNIYSSSVEQETDDASNGTAELNKTDTGMVYAAIGSAGAGDKYKSSITTTGDHHQSTEGNRPNRPASPVETHMARVHDSHIPATTREDRSQNENLPVRGDVQDSAPPSQPTQHPATPRHLLAQILQSRQQQLREQQNDRVRHAVGETHAGQPPGPVQNGVYLRPTYVCARDPPSTATQPLGAPQVLDLGTREWASVQEDRDPAPRPRGETREIRRVEYITVIQDDGVHQVPQLVRGEPEFLRRAIGSLYWLDDQPQAELPVCLLCPSQADAVLLYCQHAVVCRLCATSLTQCPSCGQFVTCFFTRTGPE